MRRPWGCRCPQAGQGPHDDPGRGRPAAAGPRPSAAVSLPGAPTLPGSATSRTSRLVKVGSTWRPSSTLAPAACWATRWPSTCARDLVADALRMAVGAQGGATAGIIFHSDRGSQYLWREVPRARSPNSGSARSVGRTGVCWDNSVAESFWSSLKRELVTATGSRTGPASTGDLRLDQPLQPPAAPTPVVIFVFLIEWENNYRQPMPSPRDPLPVNRGTPEGSNDDQKESA